MKVSRSFRRGPWTALLLVSVLGLGCDNLFPERTAGEKLYRKHCADCHGVDGSGNTIGYMGNQYANLLDEDWKYGMGAGSLTSVIRQELVFRHPSFSELSSKDLSEITRHVLELRGETSSN